MNYSSRVICLCLFYSLSLISSDGSSEQPEPVSPRKRQLTPYIASPQPEDLARNSSDSGSNKDGSEKEDDFCMLDLNSTETSDNGKPDHKNSAVSQTPSQSHPASPQLSPRKSPVRLTGQTSEHVVFSPELSDMTLPAPHKLTTATRPNTPASPITVLASMKTVHSLTSQPGAAHSPAVRKDSETPPSLFRSLPEVSVLTQRRPSGSPKFNQQPSSHQGPTTPSASSATSYAEPSLLQELFGRECPSNDELAAVKQAKKDELAAVKQAKKEAAAKQTEEKVGTPQDFEITVREITDPKEREKSCWRKIFCCCCVSSAKTKKR